MRNMTPDTMPRYPSCVPRAQPIGYGCTWSAETLVVVQIDTVTQHMQRLSIAITLRTVETLQRTTGYRAVLNTSANALFAIAVRLR